MSETYKLNRIELEVMKSDLGQMTWIHAKQACRNLGGDWRLPTKEEIEKIYKYKDRIGGFKDHSYWSSSEFSDNYAWYFNFNDGFANNHDKYVSANYVRAVRDLE
jgi:hypothetical protein